MNHLPELRIKYGVIFLQLISILMLVYAWWDGRSMYLDEVNLARNVVELDYLQFFGTLAYEQFASPFFMAIAKCIVSVFGVTDWSFRFPVVVCAVSSVFLFGAYVTKNFGGVFGGILVILLFFNFDFIFYGTTFKPYAVDLFASCLLIWASSAWEDKTKNYVYFAGLGIVLTLISMPSVFVLFSLGILLLLRQKAKRLSLLYPLTVICSWLAIFILQYLLVYKEAISDPYLKSFHSAHYFGQQGLIYTQLIDLFANVYYKTAVPIFIGAIYFISGLVFSLKNREEKVLFYGLPILACLIASYLGFYSIIPRMVYFIAPFILLMAAYGFKMWMQMSNGRLVYKYFHLIIGFVFLAAVVPVKLPVGENYARLSREEGKDVLLALAKRNDKVPVYLTHHCRPFYEYYSSLYRSPIKLGRSIIHGGYDHPISQRATDLKSVGQDRLYIADVHTFGTEKQLLMEAIGQVGKIIDHIPFHGADLYEIELYPD